MKIKLLGIDLSVGNGVALADLFAHIAAKLGAPRELSGYSRFLYTADKSGYYIGLLITTKNHNKFLEFKRDANSAKLEARETSNGAKLADFNFFVIDKSSGRGIYQYYHQSCSLNTFGLLLKSYYDELKVAGIAAARTAVTNPTAKSERQIQQRFRGTLTWATVVRKETFQKLISKFKHIRNIQINVATVAYEETIFTPLAREASRMSQRYSFSVGTPVHAVVKGVRAIFTETEVKGARAEGIGEDDLEEVVKLINTPDYFGEFEFEKIASTMTIEPSKFADSKFLDDIIEVAKQAPALQKSKNDNIQTI